MEHSQEMAEQIRARIRELENDLEAHRRALAVLEQPAAGTAMTQARRSRRSPAAGGSPEAADGTRAAGRRARRPVVSAEAVFDALKEGNDQAAAIAREFGVSTAAVRLRLEQLEQAGRVSRSGQRRGTRWRSHAAS